MPVKLPDMLAEGIAHLDSETEPELFRFLKTIARIRRNTRPQSSAEACLEIHVFNGHDLLGSPAKETMRRLLHSPGSPLCKSPARPLPATLPDELAEGVAHLDSETEPELFQFLKTIAQVRRQTRTQSSAEAYLETHVLNGHELLESPAEDTVRGLLHSPGSPLCKSPVRPAQQLKRFKVLQATTLNRLSQTSSRSKHTDSYSANPAVLRNVLSTTFCFGEHDTAGSETRASDLWKIQRPADGIVEMVSNTNGLAAALGAVFQVLAVWLLLLLGQYLVVESQR